MKDKSIQVVRPVDILIFTIGFIVAYVFVVIPIIREFTPPTPALAIEIFIMLAGSGHIAHFVTKPRGFVELRWLAVVTIVAFAVSTIIVGIGETNPAMLFGKLFVPMLYAITLNIASLLQSWSVELA